MTIIHPASKLIAERRLTKRIHSAIPESQRPKTILEGYKLQEEVHEFITPRKGSIVGFKIGCTTKIMQDFLKINTPCAGAIFESEVFDNHSCLKLSDFTRVGVECELSIQLSEDLNNTKKTLVPEELLGKIKNVAVAIEVVENRYENYKSFGVPSLIADDFFAAGMVLGSSLMKWKTADLENLKGIVRLNGDEVVHGLEANNTDHPLKALCWLANLNNKLGRPLRANHYILTGSLVETQWISSPCTIECEVKGIGSVLIDFR